MWSMVTNVTQIQTIISSPHIYVCCCHIEKPIEIYLSFYTFRRQPARSIGNEKNGTQTVATAVVTVTPLSFVV